MRRGEAGLVVALAVFAGCEDKAPEPPSRAVPPSRTIPTASATAAPAPAVNTATVEALAELEVVFRGTAMLGGVDDERIYLTRKATTGSDEDGPQEIITVPKAGGEPTVLVPRGQFNPSFAFHEGEVFYVSKEGIASVPAKGGAPVLRAEDPYAVRMIREGEQLFWTSGSHRQPKTEPGGVYALGLGDGKVAKVAKAGRPTVVVADATHVYINEMPCAYRVARAGGELDKLGCDYGALPIAVNDASLFLVSRARTKQVRSTIVRMDKATRRTERIHQVEGYVQAMVAEAGWLFVTTANSEGKGGEILALAAEGGPPKVLAKGLEDPFHIKLDATHLYVHTGEDARRVVRVRKPR